WGRWRGEKEARGTKEGCRERKMSTEKVEYRKVRENVKSEYARDRSERRDQEGKGEGEGEGEKG
ncbi:hypothetical protein OIV68_32980, partial [Burkholderia pseudomallei]|uniref:hypothetical protein n=1 Tax=Burkholderia pseudomallei TaxID=28450 RepID=UPI0021F7951D